MKVYVAGPMRNKPLENFQEFEDVSKWLSHNLNWQVTSAHDMAIGEGEADFAARYDYVDEYPTRRFSEVALRRNTNKKCAMKAIAASEGIVMLPKWQESRGAVKELLLGLWCGVRTMTASKTENGYALADLHVTEDALVAILAAHHSGRKVTAA
jgi:hypothetical protein